MVEERANRKLTAILSADVKGYSRLMGDDELSTVETLKKYREIISSLVQQYRGRVVDSPGDNILAEGGGICISETAFDQIGRKLPMGYEYMGEQEVKNIETPLRVYRVLMSPEVAGKVIGEERQNQSIGLGSHWWGGGAYSGAGWLSPMELLFTARCGPRVC